MMVTASCSSAKPAATPAVRPSPTTLPAGTITVDRWDPPPLTGGPGPAPFCSGLTALYGHMAQLSHVVSKSVTEQFLSDYVSYAPVVAAHAPAPVAPSAELYLGAVARYLRQLVAARLSIARLTPGALSALSSAPVNEAFATLSGYVTTTCHYTIGGVASG